MIWLLLVLYQIKHFVCDYPLQTPYMLRKFLKFPDFILPLLSHSLIHGFTTFLICFLIRPQYAFGAALFDTIVHFIIDRIKASPNLGGRFKPLTKETYSTATSEQLNSNTYFWWALGADQFAHHITHYIIIFVITFGRI